MDARTHTHTLIHKRKLVSYCVSGQKRCCCWRRCWLATSLLIAIRAGWVFFLPIMHLRRDQDSQAIPTFPCFWLGTWALKTSHCVRWLPARLCACACACVCAHAGLVFLVVDKILATSPTRRFRWIFSTNPMWCPIKRVTPLFPWPRSHDPEAPSQPSDWAPKQKKTKKLMNEADVGSRWCSHQSESGQKTLLRSSLSLLLASLEIKRRKNTLTLCCILLHHHNYRQYFPRNEFGHLEPLKNCLPDLQFFLFLFSQWPLEVFAAKKKKKSHGLKKPFSLFSCKTKNCL